MSGFQDAHGNQRIYSDKPFEWRPKRIYIPAWQFAGLDYETTTTTDIKSAGVGAGNDMAVTEINTSNITAINMGANADTVEHLLAVPGDMDFNKNIYFRVYWTANNTSGSVTWDVLYKTFVANSTVLGTAGATTALDTAIGAHTMAGVAFTMMQSPEGVLKFGTLSNSVEMLQLAVKRTSVATITTASFIGLEIRYSPRRLRGPDGMARESKAPAFIAGTQYT